MPDSSEGTQNSTSDLTRRSAREVLDDHLNIANSWADVPIEQVLAEDLRRNVSEDIVILINRGTFRGYEGVRELARLLAEELPDHAAFEYTYVAAPPTTPSSRARSLPAQTDPRATGAAMASV